MTDQYKKVRLFSTFSTPQKSVIILLTFAIVVMTVALGILMHQTFGVDYFNECLILVTVYESVQAGDCMSYASANPDATGAEIIKALTGESDIPSIAADLLKRPLNP